MITTEQGYQIDGLRIVAGGNQSFVPQTPLKTCAELRFHTHKREQIEMMNDIIVVCGTQPLFLCGHLKRPRYHSMYDKPCQEHFYMPNNTFLHSALPQRGALLFYRRGALLFSNEALYRAPPDDRASQNAPTRRSIERPPT